MKARMLPDREVFGRTQAEWLPGVFRLDGDHGQKVLELVRVHALLKGYRAQMMAMESPREIAQKGVLGIGCNALDDEPVPGNPECQAATLLEQPFEPYCHALGSRPQRRVAAGVHGVLVECDGKLDEKIGQLAWEGDAFAACFRLFSGRVDLRGVAR